MHWIRSRSQGWRWRSIINGIGALSTGTVLIVISLTKFVHGAWVVLVVIPTLVILFLRIHRHYEEAEQELAVSSLPTPLGAITHIVLVPISGITRPVLTALQYARSLSPTVRAVYVSTDAAATQQIESLWKQWNPGIDLVVLESPYRSIVGPLLEYIDQVQKKERYTSLVTVVLPEFVPRRWWHHLLHNQTALLLKGALLFRKDVVVMSVPYHLHR